MIKYTPELGQVPTSLAVICYNHSHFSETVVLQLAHVYQKSSFPAESQRAHLCILYIAPVFCLRCTFQNTPDKMSHPSSDENSSHSKLFQQVFILFSLSFANCFMNSSPFQHLFLTVFHCLCFISLTFLFFSSGCLD